MVNYEYETLVTCPPGAKIVGDIVRLSVDITQGSAPFTITYMKDGTPIISSVSALSIGTYYYDYTTTISDVGTSIFSVKVVDSCLLNPQSFIDGCNVIINNTPIPSCDFTWTPASPKIGDTLTVTASDTTLISNSHNWYWNTNLLSSHVSSFSVILGQPLYIGDNLVTHEGVNSYGNPCTMDKTITIIPLCTQPTCSFTVT